MSIFSFDTRLSELLFAAPTIMPVLNRFGIKAGVGEETIESICRERGEDPALLLAIVNTFFNKDYFPEEVFRRADHHSVVSYMRQTDNYYAEVQIPNIERHFNMLISSASGSNSNLQLLAEFFNCLKRELLGRIEADRLTLFPAIEQKRGVGKDIMEDILQIDNTIEDKLSDLITFFVVHLKGNYNLNLCNAVMQALFALESDIKSNNRIRRVVLFPSLCQTK